MDFSKILNNVSTNSDTPRQIQKSLPHLPGKENLPSSLKRHRVEDDGISLPPAKRSPSASTIQSTPPKHQAPLRKPRKREASPPIYAKSAREVAKPPSRHVTPQPRTSSPEGGLPSLEPSIINTTPYEEITRTIADWLFSQVVLREDIGVTATGQTAPGAIFEIEAKLGHIIDLNTNDRVSLPVLTETIISHRDPNLRTKFQSSMSERQHKTLNEFLNDALIKSQPHLPNGVAPPPSNRTSKPRKPLGYVHTKERDTFYELNQAATLNLPSAIRNLATGARGTLKPRLRVTTDAKTGRVIAKIVKARLADVEVHSPKTAFDWRISVNLEMAFDGDVDIAALGAERVHGEKERNKDRVSYRHQELYQIDLTQVIVPEDGNGGVGRKEHELEVEVSSEEIRRQGLLARDGQGNRYEEVVKGLIDNVRVLARACGRE